MYETPSVLCSVFGMALNRNQWIMRSFITEEEFQRDLELAHLYCNDTSDTHKGMFDKDKFYFFLIHGNLVLLILKINLRLCIIRNIYIFAHCITEKPYFTPC